jgi:hypothetical protein
MWAARFTVPDVKSLEVGCATRVTAISRVANSFLRPGSIDSTDEFTDEFGGAYPWLSGVKKRSGTRLDKLRELREYS